MTDGMTEAYRGEKVTRMNERSAARQDPGNLLQEDDTAARERAFMDACGTLADVFEWWDGLEARGWNDDGKLESAVRATANAYRVLTAPQPVKPEDLKPGQRFRFETWPIEDSAIVVFDALTQQKRWMVEGDSAVYHFDPERGVIPIEDSKP